MVKVLDFGVAKLVEAAAPSAETRTALATAAGLAIGTPAYMSPEQADGRPVDARSDIFSFGSVLYEMVTGRAAFGGSSPLSVLAKVLNDEPAAPSQLASLPADLEKVILRCLRKDPARRFQSMADLKVALEDLRDESARVAPAAPAAIASRPPSKSSRLVAAGALLAVAGLRRLSGVAPVRPASERRAAAGRTADVAVRASALSQPLRPTANASPSPGPGRARTTRTSTSSRSAPAHRSG